MIAVIAGATGLVGHQVLTKLLADSSFKSIIAVTRKALEIRSPKLINVICENFDDLLLKKEDLRGDVYFCSLGTTIKKAESKENFKKIDYDAVYLFAQIASLNKESTFVLVSASGANSQSPIFYNRVKGDIENILIDLKLKHLIIFRPGLLMGERVESRPAEKMAIEFVKMASLILPKNFNKMISTDINLLSNRMIVESLLKRAPLKIIEAKDI